MSSKVLVTGSTGFVGRHLVPKLIDCGYQVRVASRSSSSPFRGVEIVEVGDYLRNPDWDKAVAGVNAVVHLAARVHVMRDTAHDPHKEFRRMNVTVTRELADASLRGGVGRFIFVSSIKVNGEKTEPGRRFTAFDIPNPQDPYAMSKLQAEEALSNLGQSSGLPITIIRPPLVYGPGVGGNFLRLLKLAGSGLPLPLSTASNRRSMVFVQNLIDRLLLALSAGLAGVETALVADNESVSTRELLELISQSLGKTGRLFGLPQTLLRTAANLTGLSNEYDRLFGSLEVQSGSTRDTIWEAPVSAVDGITQTCRWYQSRVARPP